TATSRSAVWIFSSAGKRPTPSFAISECRGGLDSPPRGGLADLDEVAIGVADVAPLFVRVLLGRRQELGPLSRPFLVALLDIGNAKVQERARSVSVGRGFENDIRFVIGGTAAHVDDDPGIGELDHGGNVVEHDFATEHISIESGRAFDVTAGNEVSK